MNAPAAPAPAAAELRDADDLEADEADEAACGQTTEPDDTCTSQGCEGCQVEQPPSPLALGLALMIGALLRRRPGR